MAQIEELRIAPVKALRAEDTAVDQVVVDARGLIVGDREYMVVEGGEHVNAVYERGHVAPRGHFLSQREDPVLTHIVPKLGKGGLLLTAEGREELWVPRAEDVAANRMGVSVWKWHGDAVDQGDNAAEWLSDIVGRSVRLVAVSDESPRYVENDPALGRVGFADGFELTVGSPEGFDALNAKLVSQGKQPIPRDRARTTMVVSGLEVPDLPEGAFPEDYIQEMRIASNGLVLVIRRWKACGRCPVPDTDQRTGERDPRRPVIAALAALGRHGYHLDQVRYSSDAEVFFTQNCVLELPTNMPPDGQIVIHRGAEVEVVYDTQPNWMPKTRE